MCQRKRYGVLLLLAGLASLPPRPAPAQVLPANAAAPQVIATATAPPPKATEPKIDTPLPPPPVGPETQQAAYVAPLPKAAEPKSPPAPPPRPEPPPEPDGWQKAAGLSVLVVGPENAAPGQAVACQIRVKNRGPHTLAEVGVELPVPAGTRVVPADPDAEHPNDTLRWKLGDLEPDHERTLRFELQSAEPGEVHLRPRATFAPGVGLRTAVVRPPFSLSVTGPEAATLGEKVVFTVQVGNHTGSPIAGVNLRCDLSGGVVHAEGEEITMDLPEPLQPSQVKSIQLETLARAAGRHQIRVAASAGGGHRGEASWSIALTEAGLAVAQSGPRRANVGDVLTYRLEVRNPGRTPVGPVRLSQALPEGVGFGSASAAGVFELATQSIVWTLPALRPGQTQAVTFAAQGRKPGDWAMPASASAAGVADARTTHAVRVDSTPAAGLRLEMQEDRLPVNGETICQARLSNQGPDPMRDARLVVQLPAGLEVVGIEGPTRWQQRGKQIVFEPLAELRPRVDAIYRMRVRVVGPDATVRAELDAAGLEKPRQAFRALQILGPAGGR